MELATQPDMYSPSIDINNNYVDSIPSFNKFRHGLRCPCASRKDKIYLYYQSFSNHIKANVHQKWLKNLNENKVNFYTENEILRTTIENQKLIIAKMDKEIQNKRVTIDYLIQQLVTLQNENLNKQSENLLDINSMDL